jgi:uncharacterized membrane protein YdbT with pleckstrin-like domain
MLPIDILEEGEGIIFEEHPQLGMTLFWSWVFGGLLLLLAIICLFISPFVGIGILLVAIVMPLIQYLQWRATIYGLTSGRIIRLKGLIGKDLYENRLEKIQDLRLKIGILQRTLNCGDILITTAGTAGIECAWRDIKNPREKQRILRNMLGS